MKLFKFLLALAAMGLSSTAMAEVTEVYSIDLTGRTENPFENNNDQVTMDETDGLVHTGGGQFWIAKDVPFTNLQFYTVKAMMKSSEAKNVHIYVGNYGDDFGGDISLTTEFQEVSFKIQGAYTANCFFSVQHWGWSGTISVKSVTVTTGDEGYDSDLLCLQATNIPTKEYVWDNQISYSFSEPLEPGSYNIAFDLYGNADGEVLLWGDLAQKDSPEDADYKRDQYNGFETKGWYGGGSYNVVNGEWKHYEATINFPETNGEGEDLVYVYCATPKFLFGTYTGTDLYIDNVVLRKAGSDVDLIPNGDFSRMAMNKWGKGWGNTFDLAIANGPEHPEKPANTRTADANSVWFGEKVMGWGDGVTIDASVFADLQFGDKLKFEYGDDRYVQILFGGWPPNDNCNTSPWEAIYTYKNEAGRSYAEIEITEALKDYAREEGEEGSKTTVHYNIYNLLKTGGLAMQAGGNTVYEIIYIPVNKVAFVDAENSISFNNNYAGKEDEEWVVNNLILKDGMIYKAANDFTAKYVEYTRDFTNTAWQPLYVPFDIAYSEWSEKGEVAELTSVDNTDGKITLTWNTVTFGSLTPNTPYVIKPAVAGEVTFIAQNKSVKANAEESLVKSPITLTGVYTTKTDMATDNAYGLSNGTFYKTSTDDKTLKPFRFYLKVSAVTGAGAPPRIANIIDNNNVSGIEDIIIEDTDNGIYYDLQGRIIQNPTTGFYINNGKKVIIR